MRVIGNVGAMGAARTAGIALAILLVVAPDMMAQPAPGTPIDLSTLGPKVGERVPDFKLTDQDGKAWTRDSIMGPKGAMLVFFRSADW
ncbi:MAG: hypothetical protein AB7N65_26135 [Vicinamibacterales bacterium]